MNSRLILALAALAVAVPPALPAAVLGDPAAPLKLAEWVKGQPVQLAEGKGKTVYVVEFWATWCPPCRASIPHLTQLQKKYKDKGVVFIGISDEKPATVKKFVEQMADKMDYRVALDQDRKTSGGYLEAYDISGIPHAFIVDKEGRVVWNGHPMGGLEAALDQVLAGKLDLAKEKQRAAAQKKLEQLYELAGKGASAAELEKLGQEIEALDKELGGITPGEKFSLTEVLKQVKFQAAMNDYPEAVLDGTDAPEIAKLEAAVKAVAPKDFQFDEAAKMIKFQALLRQYQEAVQGGKTGADVDKLAAQVKALSPKDFNLDELQEGQKAQALFAQYVQAVGEGGDKDKAADLARQLEEAPVKNAQVLNEFAWTLLTGENIKQRNLPLATRLAKAALDASEGQDAAILDTYARALFDSGKVADAVATQKKAVAACEDEDLKRDLEATLKKYQDRAEKAK